jgi:hypothetical protein
MTPSERWWLVPNLFALDAPVVAVVWQRFFAARFQTPTPWPATLALFAAVWCIYLFDRSLDARRGAIAAARHRIAAKHPRGFFLGAVLAGILSLAAAAALPIEYIRYGVVVGLAIAAYLVLVHAVEWRVLGFGGAKEFLVAVGFAAGVAAPLAVGSRPTVEWFPSVAAFGGVCWLNCRLIEHWECSPPSAPWSAALVWLVILASAPALPVAIAWAVAASTFGLGVVHAACRTAPEPARVFADIVLLSPLALGCVP